MLTIRCMKDMLLQRIARQVVQFGSVSWLRSIGRCIGEFGWQDLSGNAIRSVKGRFEEYVVEHCMEESKRRVVEGIK